MKTDVLLGAAILALTLLIPAIFYSQTVDGWAQSSLESTRSAQRYEQLAIDTEVGKIKPDMAGLPAYLRMQAAGARTLASMFANLAEGSRKLMSAMVGVLGVQAGLLAWLVFRRRSAGGVHET
jgi:hypothetical protein